MNSSAIATALFTPAPSAAWRIQTQVFHARAFLIISATAPTHTIEVSRIARTVSGDPGAGRESYRSAGSGAHDIGTSSLSRTPAKRNWINLMRRSGERFEHNRHGSAHRRIASKIRPARFPGLNLTFEVREGIVKHSRDFEPGEFPELDEYLPGLGPALDIPAHRPLR